MPETCGQNYMSMVVTVDGYTPANPYGAVAVPGDYAGWRNLARSLATVLHDHFEHLENIEERLQDEGVQHGFPQRAALLNEQRNLAKRVEDLPSMFWASLTGSNVTSAIDLAVRLTTEQVCHLERIDAAIIEYGETPHGVPAGPAPKPPPRKNALRVAGWVGGALVVIGTIFGLGWATARRRAE